MESNSNEINLDLKDIFRILKKKWLLILAITLTTTIMSGVISFIIPPTYQASAILRIKDPQGSLASSLFSSLPVMNAAYTQQLMSTYIEILKSRNVVMAAFKNIDSKKGTLLTYEAMLKRINVKPVNDTQILAVTVEAESADQAQKLTNTLVDAFLDRLAHLERSEQGSVREFIGVRLEASKKDLLKAEQELEIYKQTQQILAPDEEIKTMVERFAQNDQLAAENQLNIATLQAKLESVQAQLSNENKGPVADSPLIQQYNSKLAGLEIQLVGLLEKYTAKHPEVLATRAEIEETKKQLSIEINRVINDQAPSLNQLHQNLLLTKLQSEAEIKAAQAQKESIAKIQAAHEVEIRKLPAKEQGLTRLMRDASVAQEIYIMLAKHYEEAKITEVMQPVNVQIIDQAVAPDKPIKPNKRINILSAAFLGIFAGTGLVFLGEYLNKTIDTADDVKHYLGIPVLGSIPDYENVKNGNVSIWQNKLNSIKTRKPKKERSIA
ncbi:MAG TPA: GumC family protein [Bacillota bacterium]|nr:GumC family protein [Bacillota bacterium]